MSDGRFETAQSVELRGLEARAVQHQLDHLDGILVLDRAASRPERPRLARSARPGTDRRGNQ